jgi:hypothetical protein
MWLSLNNLRFKGQSLPSLTFSRLITHALLFNRSCTRLANPLLRQLKAAEVEYGQVMPNIPQMGRFFSSVSGALRIATEGRDSAKAALEEAEANMLHH